MALLYKAYRDENGEITLLLEGSDYELIAAGDSELERVPGSDKTVSNDGSTDETPPSTEMSNEVNQTMQAHENAVDPHSQYNTAVETQAQIDIHEGSLNNHDDVNSPTNSPKKYLRVNASGIWEPYSNYYNTVKAGLTRPGQTTVGLVSRNSSYQTYLSIPILPTETDNYIIGGRYDWSKDSTTVDFLVTLRLFRNNVQIWTSGEFRAETKDSAGTGPTLNQLQNNVIVGNRAAGTDQKYLSAFLYNFTLDAGVNYRFDIDWRPSSDGVEATIFDAEIIVEQKTINL